MCAFFSLEFELPAVRMREGAAVQGVDEVGQASVRRTRGSQQGNFSMILRELIGVSATRFSVYDGLSSKHASR
jgi:hypothetical protein